MRLQRGDSADPAGLLATMDFGAAIRPEGSVCVVEVHGKRQRDPSGAVRSPSEDGRLFRRPLARVAPGEAVLALGACPGQAQAA